MFTTARIKLTIWYLLIIMLISIMFSFSIYNILNGELERGFHRISDRYTQEYGPMPTNVHPQALEPAYLQASEDRIKWILLYVNLIILGVSGVGGYILAGITLRPIKKMIDEQNRFITDASHELRTPITSLKSEIEVYLRGKNHDTKEAHTLLQSNLEEVNNLQVLSDSLIALAQSPTATRIQNFTAVSIQNVIQRATDKLQKQAKQKNIQIKTFIPNHHVHGNEENLIQLFVILLDNAIKYSPKKSTITMHTKKTDGFLDISVTDEGIGIDEKDIPHVFDRFYRSDTSRTKQEIPGYGLGLSIAKKIITEHHGAIEIQSKKDKGTTCTVRLPLIA